MKITLTTAGILADHLPDGAQNNQVEIELAEGATPVDVMEQLSLPADDFYLVIVNDEVVPKPKRGQTILLDGDDLGIFPPLKGG